MVKPGPRQPRIGDHFGDVVSMMFGPAFESPHLKKTNDCKIFVPILKKQRPRSDNERARRVVTNPALTTALLRAMKNPERSLEANVCRVAPFLFSQLSMRGT